MDFTVRTLISLAGFALGMDAAGQPRPADAPPLVRLAFTCYAIELLSEPLSFVAESGGAPVPVTFYRAGRSPRYDYVGPMPIRFFASMASDGSEPDAARSAENAVILAEADVPPGVREALFLLVPAPSDPARPGARPLRVLVLDDSAAAFPPRRLRVYNGSGRWLRARFDERESMLPPGLAPQMAADSSMQVELRTQARGRSYLSYRGTIELGRDARALLIILPSRYPDSPEVEVRVLRDEVKTLELTGLADPQ